MFGQLASLFGSNAAVPALSQVGGNPTMGGFVAPQAMQATRPMFTMPQGMNYDQVAAMLQQANAIQQPQQPPMPMPMAPAPMLQAGGDAFVGPYHDRRKPQVQPGLLGGAYGIV